MRLFPTTVATPSTTTETRSVTYNDIWGRGDEPSSTSAAGEIVDQTTSLTLSAVYGSVRILTHGVSQSMAEMTKGTSPNERAEALPVWLVQPAETFFLADIIQQVMHSLLMRGNAFIATKRTATGELVELTVLDPDQVEPTQTSMGVRYKVGTASTLYHPLDIHHIRGATLRAGQLKADDPITYWRECVGLGLAAQSYGADVFNNGGLPGAVIELPPEVESPSRTALGLMRKQWDEMYSKKGNRASLAVLTRGAAFKAVSITPDKAQSLETRGFQVADVARFFGVPPHLLQDATNSTSWGSGLAEQSQNFLVHSLRPWVMKLQTSLTWLARSEQAETVRANSVRNVYLRLDHLTEGTFDERARTYGYLFGTGVVNQDEARAQFGYPPLPDDLGKRFYIPVNLQPVDLIANEPEPSPDVSDGSGVGSIDSVPVTDDTSEEL